MIEEEQVLPAVARPHLAVVAVLVVGSVSCFENLRSVAAVAVAAAAAAWEDQQKTWTRCQ